MFFYSEKMLILIIAYFQIVVLERNESNSENGTQQNPSSYH